MLTYLHPLMSDKISVSLLCFSILLLPQWFISKNRNFNNLENCKSISYLYPINHLNLSFKKTVFYLGQFGLVFVLKVGFGQNIIAKNENEN